MKYNYAVLFTSGSRGAGIPAPMTPDLEAPVYNLEVPVYNLKAKQLILGSLFYIFLKNISSLTLLSMNLIFLSHSSSLTLLIISSSYVHTSTLCGFNP